MTQASIREPPRPGGQRPAGLRPGAGAVSTIADLELGFARLSAAIGPCAHPGAVPVALSGTGAVVAWLCPGCGARLPARWAEP